MRPAVNTGLIIEVISKVLGDSLAIMESIGVIKPGFKIYVSHLHSQTMGSS